MIGFNSETKFNVKNTRWRLAGDQRFKGFKPWTIQATFEPRFSTFFLHKVVFKKGDKQSKT